MHGGECQHFWRIEFEIVIACPAEENCRIEMRLACRLGDLARAFDLFFPFRIVSGSHGSPPSMSDFLQASRRFFEKISKREVRRFVLTLYWRWKREFVRNFPISLPNESESRVFRFFVPPDISMLA